MSTLGTTHITKLTAKFPGSGGWHTEVELEGGAVPSGAVILKIGNLVLSGDVLRAKEDNPGKPRAVVVGGIGWQNLITSPLSFQSDAGIRLSTVLDAFATGAGQRIEQPTDQTIGSYYECVASRPGEPVRWADALADLAQAGYVGPWRVDPDGVTRFGARPALAVTARATEISSDASIGRTTYGVDAPAEFLPGHTVAGSPIASSEIREEAGKLEVDVYTTEPKGAPSLRELVRRLVGSAMASALQDAVRTYVVATVHADGRMDLLPLPDAQHLPEMRNVKPWVLGGVKYQPTEGEEVTVMFRDRRRTRPIVIGYELSEGPFAGLARLGDSVTVMLPPANFVGTVSGGPATGIVTWSPGQTMGTITTSSANTKGGP